jgi:hypothetical protein
VAKSKRAKDEERENRILMEVVVDAYDAVERAMGWYHYLTTGFSFPFSATCVGVRSMSPLELKDEVEVIGVPDEDDCAHEMFVTIRWQKRGLAVPLSQLKPHPDTDEMTRQMVEDWHYWVRMGYSLG